jgi:hypothetical protein
MSPVPVLIPSASHCCNPTRIHHHHYEAQITSTPSPSSPHLHQPGATSLIPARIATHRRLLSTVPSTAVPCSSLRRRTPKPKPSQVPHRHPSQNNPSPAIIDPDAVEDAKPCFQPPRLLCATDRTIPFSAASSPLHSDQPSISCVALLCRATHGSSAVQKTKEGDGREEAGKKK